MNQMKPSPTCDRGDDLVSFLYGEASELEAQDFEVHLHQCRTCQMELASFGNVRESVCAWKDEVLSGWVATHAVAPAKQKSALAAVREFFDLSPLWLKGAVGLATVLFCVLAVLALGRLGNTSNPQVVVRDSQTGFSKEQVEAIVAKALADQAAKSETDDKEEAQRVIQKVSPKRTSTQSVKWEKSRRPLSRTEREQLAADLRLLYDDELDLHLLGERINQ